MLIISKIKIKNIAKSIGIKRISKSIYLQFKEPWTNLKATRNKNLSKLSKININKNKKYTNIDKPEKMKKIDINEKMIIMEKKVDIPENKMNEMIEFYNKYHVKREVNNVVKKEVLDFTNFGTLIVLDKVEDEMNKSDSKEKRTLTKIALDNTDHKKEKS
jgi:hypothetical protein